MREKSEKTIGELLEDRRGILPIYQRHDVPGLWKYCGEYQVEVLRINGRWEQAPEGTKQPVDLNERVRFFDLDVEEIA